MKNLVIVESPAKAKTIEKILGKNYKVVASFGHVRDLPKSNLGVDVEHDFEPKYIIPTKAKKTIKMLKEQFKKSDSIFLATDLDREGEAIAWHIVEAIKPSKKQVVKRVVFPSITKLAVEKGMQEAREINLDLVDAQQARRVLDRLVGYKLSPLLWRKIFKGLSAGRVQSVALRLVVEREREIQAFKPEEYWTVEANFLKDGAKDVFRSKLLQVNDADFLPINEQEAKEKEKLMQGATYLVDKLEAKDKKRNPYAPFITSTLQQEAYRRLRFSAKKTMMLAQKLYEGVEISGEQVGLITYMRTDSYNISPEGIKEIRKVITKICGQVYLPDKPILIKKKSKMAQEAHEAIRATYPGRLPKDVKQFLDNDLYRLYELIWKRTIASQMVAAVFDLTVLDIVGKNKNDKFLFRSNGVVMKFDGFLKIWDYAGAVGEDVVLPVLTESDKLNLNDLFIEQHFTKPPARYSEATLVKELEKNGVGRPSTYASIMSTIQSRGYVQKEEGRFVPQEVGFLVNDFLVENFQKIVDAKFTAKMEEDLDKIALGKNKWVPVIRDFYLPFEKEIEEKDKTISKKAVLEQPEVEELCPKCGKKLLLKMSRFGKFFACSGFPDCKYTKPAGTSKEEEEMVNKAEPCEKCGSAMILKKGRFGSFLACSKYPECKNIRSLGNEQAVDCPKCKDGKLQKRRSKRGRIFWGCNNYPKCDMAVWNEPTDQKCEKCGFVLTKNKAGNLVCEKCQKKDKKKE